MWITLADRMLQRFVQHGTLHVAWPDGRICEYGNGRGTCAAINVHSPDFPRRMAINPDLAVGEGYVNGDFVIKNDDLHGFLTVLVQNIALQDAPIWWQRPLNAVRTGFRWVSQINPVARARANVAHHYDLSRDLYRLFLDRDMQYSCAYFQRPSDSLEQAQIDKKIHIANKLLIEPGMRILDIGCGWGGMALTLARDYGAQVVGVTLSKEQHLVATQRAKAAGLDRRIDFRLQDYRHVKDSFDRIVSIGMFEHVGQPHYGAFFRMVRDALTPDGVALIHTIGRSQGPRKPSPWMQKHIFPGSYAPSLSEVLRPMENKGLYVADIEILRLHYADTLMHWQRRFAANIGRVRALYDDRFCRMWNFYLLSMQFAFRFGLLDVAQFQLSKEFAAVPITRDYMCASPVAPVLNAAE